MRDIKISTWANGYGVWHAEVSPAMPDNTEDRERAREAIVREISYREQKTWESFDETLERVGETVAVECRAAEFAGRQVYAEAWVDTEDAMP